MRRNVRWLGWFSVLSMAAAGWGCPDSEPSGTPDVAVASDAAGETDTRTDVAEDVADAAGDGDTAAPDAPVADAVPDLSVADVPPPPPPDEAAVVEGEHFDSGSASEVLTADQASGALAALLASASGQAAGRVGWNQTAASYTINTTAAGPHSLCARVVSATGDGPIGLTVSNGQRIELDAPVADWVWACIPYNVTAPVTRLTLSYWNGDNIIDRLALVRPAGAAPQGVGPAAAPTCGNGVCQAGEGACGTCDDCCPVMCGDGICHAEETCATCDADCGSCGASYTGLCHGVGDIVALPAGHWCMVPGSSANAVEKRPEDWADYDGSSSASFDSFQRVVGFRAIMGAWGGAAMDRTRDRLVCFGGGHNDYGGNELIAFDMHALAWERLSDPTAFPNRAPDVANPDGTPVSRHTYDGLAYIDHADAYFVLGGAPDNAGGVCGSDAVFTFDFAARQAAGAYAPTQWTQHAVTGTVDSHCEDNAVYDPVSQRVFYHSQNQWSAFDMAAQTWAALGPGDGPGGASAVLAGARRVIIEVGGGLAGVRRFDADSPTLAGETLVTSGDTDIESASNPGLAYDPNADVVVAWRGGADIYVLDLDTLTWTHQSPLATNLAVPGAVIASGGTYGRFAYSPNLNAYVVVNTTASNVFIYRHAAVP